MCATNRSANGFNRGPQGAIRQITSALSIVTRCHHQNMKMCCSHFLGAQSTINPKKKHCYGLEYHGLDHHCLEYHGRESYHFHCVSAANAWASAHALSMVMWFNQQIVTDLCSLLNIFCSAWLRTLQ